MFQLFEMHNWDRSWGDSPALSAPPCGPLPLCPKDWSARSRTVTSVGALAGSPCQRRARRLLCVTVGVLVHPFLGGWWLVVGLCHRLSSTHCLWPFVLFPVWAVMRRELPERSWTISVWCMFHFSGVHAGSGIAALQGKCMFSFSQGCQSVFHHDNPKLSFYHQCVSVLVAPHPCQYLLLSVFFVSAILVYGVGAHCGFSGHFSDDWAGQHGWGGSMKSQGSSLLSSCSTILGAWLPFSRLPRDRSKVAALTPSIMTVVQAAGRGACQQRQRNF